MSGPEEARFTILVKPESPRPAPEIGRVLAAVLDLHITDATVRARYCGGIVASGLERQAAEAITVHLAALGIAVRTVEDSALENLPRGRRIRSLEILSDALCAEIPGGGDLVVLREEILGIHVHALPPLEDMVPEKPAPEGARRKPNASEPTTLSARGQRLKEALLAAGDPPPHLVVTLLRSGGAPALRAFREDLDYTSLGPRKLAHSLDNFLLVLENLQAFLPGVWMAERIGRFLERLDPAEFLYFKREEGQNFERWMQLWIGIRELPGEALGPSSSV